jgi:hypothetical protein
MDEEGIVSVAFEGFPGVARPRRRVPVARRENRNETAGFFSRRASGMPAGFSGRANALAARASRE